MATEKSAGNRAARGTRSWLWVWGVVGVLVGFGAGGAWGQSLTAVSAGSDQTVLAGSGVLTRTAVPTGGVGSLSYLWTATKDGSPFVLSGTTNAVSYDFDPAAVGVYVLSVAVTDSDTPPTTLSGSVTITVNPVPNVAPTATAGISSSGDEDTPQVITLAGTDPEAQVLTYAIVGLPGSGTLYQTTDGVTLGLAITSVPMGVSSPAHQVIYVPAVNASGSGIGDFTFAVNDGEWDSAPATVTVEVAPVNDPPVAEAGSSTGDEDVQQLITLVGTDPEAQVLTYAIVGLPGSGTLYQTTDGVTLGLAISSVPTVVSSPLHQVIYVPVANASGAEIGSFTFAVNDGTWDSSPATVTVDVAPVNDPPVASVTGSDVTGTVGMAVDLVATSSTDVDGTIASYVWSFTNVPVGSAVTNVSIGDATAATTSFVPDVAGSYVLSLQVADNGGATDTEALTVVVTTVGTPSNAGATFSLTTPTELNVGVGGTATVGISGANLVNVRQAVITLEVNPPDAFDLFQTSFTPPAPGISPGIELPGEGEVKGGFAIFSPLPGFNGTADLGTFTLRGFGSQVPISEVQIIIRVIEILVGPNSSDHAVFGPEVGLSVTVNPSETAGVPVIVPPGTHDFGVVALNTPTPWTITVENSGAAPLTVYNIILGGADADQFAVAPFSPVTVPAASGSTNGSAAVTSVTFTPTSPGSKSATLVIYSDDALTPQTAPIVVSGTGEGAAITAQPASLDLGSIDLGASQTASFTVGNDGSALLTITSITSSDPEFTVSPTSFDVLVGQSQAVGVTFIPTSVGPKTATLTIQSTDPNTPTIHVTLSGTGQGAIITGVPAFLNLGDQALNTSYTASFTITNTGNTAMDVYTSLSGTGADQFAVSPSSFTVAGGQSQPVGVTFTPTSMGVKSAALVLYSPQATTPTTQVALIGTGQGAGIVAPAQVSLGSVELGSASTQSFSVVNIGRSTLTVTSIASSDEQFTASPLSFSVLAGQSQQVSVTLVPTSVGPKTATLTIDSNDPITPAIQVALSGTGTQGGIGLTVDFDASGFVNFDDFFFLMDKFGLSAGQPGFSPLFDTDGDGRVEYGDLFIFADNFGRTADQIEIPSPPGPPGPGPYANAGASFYLGDHITGLSIPGVGPGQEVQFEISGEGLVGVKNFLITLEVSPAEAFDMVPGMFGMTANPPLITGGAITEGNQIRLGGVALGTPVTGAATLGTVHLRTSASFIPGTEATIQVVGIAAGTSSTEQDVFGDLDLIVNLNPASVTHRREAVFPGEPLDIYAEISRPGIIAVGAQIHAVDSPTPLATISLTDNGTAPDEQANDHTYSGRWAGGSQVGKYAIDLLTEDEEGEQTHHPGVDFFSITRTILSIPDRILVSPEQLSPARIPLLLEDNGAGYLTGGFRATEFSISGSTGVGLGASQPVLNFAGTALAAGGFAYAVNFTPSPSADGWWSLEEALASASLLHPSPTPGPAQQVLAYVDMDLAPATPAEYLWLSLYSMLEEDEASQLYTSGAIELGRGDVDFNHDIGAFDASLVLMHTVHKFNLYEPDDPLNDPLEAAYDFTLPESAEIAADVSGKMGISALDAAYILQREVGLITHFPAEEDYYRLWDPPAWWNPPANTVAAKPVAAAPALRRVVSLGAVEEDGEQVVVPIEIDAMEDILAGSLALRYPAEGWRVAGVRKGPLTAGYLVAHKAENGEVRMAFAGPQAPSQGGRLFEVVFSRAGNEGAEAGAWELSEVQLNEGEVEVSMESPVAGKVAELPRELALDPNYPNPFNPRTVVGYDLPAGGAVEISVYDLAGQRVRRLWSGWQEGGHHQVEWDGRDEQGRSVASGLYLYQLVTPQQTLVRKMLLLR